MLVREDGEVSLVMDIFSGVLSVFYFVFFWESRIERVPLNESSILKVPR